MTTKKSNLGYKITIIILVLLSVYLIIDKVFTTKENSQLIVTLEENTYQKDSLRDELNELYLSYATLETNNQSINDSLDKQQAKVKKLIEELKNVKSSDYAKIQQLKKEIETLKNVMKSFVSQIDSLYQQNQILKVENKEIKNQYNQVVTENETLITQKDSLAQTVSIAKELKAYNINFVASNKRDKTTDRIKKTEKFQVCFMISENKITSIGRKNVYLRIAKPDGEILRNNNSGFFNYQGESIAFSSSKEIDYNGNSQNVCIFYLVEVEGLPEGKYTAFIFVDGFIIGDQKITLK